MKKICFRPHLIYLLVVLTVAGCARGAPQQPTQPPGTSTEAAYSPTSLPSATTQPSATGLPSATVQPSATDKPTQAVEAAGTITPFVASNLDMMPGCTMMSLFPTPVSTETSPFPVVSADDWVQGPETAAVTIIEYSDFQ